MSESPTHPTTPHSPEHRYALVGAIACSSTPCTFAAPGPDNADCVCSRTRNGTTSSVITRRGG